MSGEFRRTLGLRDAIVIGAGSMIGAGVFAAWSPAAAAAGEALLFGLVIAGAIAFCNATSSAQLAALHPESGGTYVYARFRLGPAWGHLAGWGFVVGKTASCAAMALTIGAYVWPAHPRVVGAVAVVLITGVNLGGISRTVRVTRALLTVSLTALAVAVAATWSGSEASLSTVDFDTTTVHGTLQSAGLLFFAFAGYARIATLGEEVRDPARTIPRAIPLALALVLSVYLIVAITLLAALPVGALADTATPVQALVAGRHASLGWVVRVGATIASLGVLLNLIPGVSRTVLAMARRQELPSVLARVDHGRNVPVVAELHVAAIVVVLVAALDLRDSIAVSGVAVLTYYAVTNLAALTLAEPERRFPRVLAAAGLVGCVVLLLALPIAALVGGLVVLGTGVTARHLAERSS